MGVRLLTVVAFLLGVLLLIGGVMTLDGEDQVGPLFRLVAGGGLLAWAATRDVF